MTIIGNILKNFINNNKLCILNFWTIKLHARDKPRTNDAISITKQNINQESKKQKTSKKVFPPEDNLKVIRHSYELLVDMYRNEDIVKWLN